MERCTTHCTVGLAAEKIIYPPGLAIWKGRGAFLYPGRWGAGFQKSGDRLSKTERRGEPDGTSLKRGGCRVGGGRTGRDASSFVHMRVDRATAAAQRCGGLFVIPFTLHKHRRHPASVAHPSPSRPHRADDVCIDLKCLHSAYTNSQIKNDLHKLSCKSLIALVPVVWIEQTTYRLQGDCSTTELYRRRRALYLPARSKWHSVSSR